MGRSFRRLLNISYLIGYVALPAITITLALAIGGPEAAAQQPSGVQTRPGPDPNPETSPRRPMTRRAAPISSGPQHDGPFVTLRSKHKAAWEAQDGEIDRKFQALQQRFNKPPNIIYILADDVGWGELGCYLGGKLRGAPTPTIDRMAAEGMKFLAAYSEPSCTPSRIALMTGRHPVRTGLTTVLWPGATAGLASEEVTLAEVLSAVGYETAMWGKWHLGELTEYAPENQGFDYAYYGLYNGAPFGWADVETFYQRQAVGGSAFWYDFPGERKYMEMYGIRLQGFFRGRKGSEREEAGPINSEAMDKFEAECAREIVVQIKEKAKSDRPFFFYWATYANQIAGSPKDYRFNEGVDSVNNQAPQMAAHDDHLDKILTALTESGIAENTLVVWISDNGPMYAFYPTSGYSWLRGGKGDVLEGGVRVPAIAWWPGMIAAGQDPVDLIQLTDLFTTGARVGGALEQIPDDRIIDGVDQTALLLIGEGNSRRNYLFHYAGDRLGAVRLNDFKFHLPAGGGAVGIKAYNIMRDPGEKFGEVYPLLWMIEPMQRMVTSHNLMIERFPHRKPKRPDVDGVVTIPTSE